MSDLFLEELKHESPARLKQMSKTYENYVKIAKEKVQKARIDLRDCLQHLSQVESYWEAINEELKNKEPHA